MPYIRRTKLITKSNDHRAPNNIRYDPVLRKTISRLCQCPPPPPPITRSYTIPGSFVDILPSLPPGYIWQVVGIVLGSAGGGGGGGGGASFFGGFTDGAGGTAGQFSVLTAFNNLVVGGTSLVSTVGVGGLGGVAGATNVSGSNGTLGGDSSIVYDMTTILSAGGSAGNGGASGGGTISYQGQPGFNGGGSGGDGEHRPFFGTGTPAVAGSNGVIGNITFTATPIRQ